MNTARTVGIFVLGLIIGAIAGAIGVVVLLRSAAGAGLIAQYVVTQPQWPSAYSAQSASSTQMLNGIIAGTTVVPVPKAYASAQYATALNASLRQVAVIAASSTALGNLLTTINNKSIAHDYNGFFDLIVEAKTGVAAQRAQVAALGHDLSTLATLNQNTPDAATKQATSDLVAQGNYLTTALTTYTDALDQLLSGTVPTVEQIDAVKSQGEAVAKSAAAFSTAAQALVQRFQAAQ